MKVVLEYPVEVHGARISEVEVRRLKGSDLLEMDRWKKDGIGDGETTLRLISLLTGIPFESAEEMDSDDITAISEVLENFSRKAKATRASPRRVA